MYKNIGYNPPSQPVKPPVTYFAVNITARQKQTTCFMYLSDMSFCINCISMIKCQITQQKWGRHSVRKALIPGPKTEFDVLRILKKVFRKCNYLPSICLIWITLLISQVKQFWSNNLKYANLSTSCSTTIYLKNLFIIICCLWNCSRAMHHERRGGNGKICFVSWHQWLLFSNSSLKTFVANLFWKSQPVRKWVMLFAERKRLFFLKGKPRWRWRYVQTY